jgi:2,3-dihydroxybiphenyl 1,2-dioxygenase
MTVGNLGYLGFAVSDLAAWETFAPQMLGLMAVPGPDGTRRFRADTQAWRFSIEQGEKNDLAFLGFEVSGPAELEKMRARLRAADVKIWENDHHLAEVRGVTDLIACQDPEGLPIEIYYGATQATETPFVSPAGVSGFVTGSQGIGHVVLSTADIAKARKFYSDALGLKISDFIRMKTGPDSAIELEFYHCNTRHHTLALAPVPSPRRMHHFMLQAKTIDDVGYALDRATRQGVRIAQGLGRHTNDQMVSFYAYTPSGFEVEFGIGGVEVDDASWHVTRHDSASSWGHKRNPQNA